MVILYYIISTEILKNIVLKLYNHSNLINNEIN